MTYIHFIGRICIGQACFVTYDNFDIPNCYKKGLIYALTSPQERPDIVSDHPRRPKTTQDRLKTAYSRIASRQIAYGQTAYSRRASRQIQADSQTKNIQSPRPLKL